MYTLPKHGQLCEHKVNITLYEPNKNMCWHMHVLPKNACWLDMPKMATLVAHQKGWTCQKWQDFIHAIANKWHGVYAQALDAFFPSQTALVWSGHGRLLMAAMAWAPHLAFMVFPWLDPPLLAGFLVALVSVASLVLVALAVWGSMGLLGLAPALWWTPSGMESLHGALQLVQCGSW